jgi:hypothetical protein
MAVLYCGQRKTRPAFGERWGGHPCIRLGRVRVAIVGLRPAPVKEAEMRSEAEIRLMLQHMRGLVQKYQAVKEQAAANGDQEAERAAWTKEVSYVSAAQALEWAAGDIEASFEEGDAVLVQ